MQNLLCYYTWRSSIKQNFEKAEWGEERRSEMKRNVVAVYERKSTLWKNANGFYRSQDWCRMECSAYDYTEEINNIAECKVRWFDSKGNDVTEAEIEKCYGKPYVVTLINERGTNSRSWSFKTKEEANEFFKMVINDKILKGWVKKR